MDLTNDDVADILALLDSLPYGEFDLQTSRFRLTLRRTPDGWTQRTQVLSAPAPPLETASMEHWCRNSDTNAPSMSSGQGPEAPLAGREEGMAGDGGDEGADEELVAVWAPLPGTFYRAPRPGAAPFVEVGSRVDADTVIGIVETMKLMNSVHAGVAGEVAAFCVANAEFAERGATLLRIRADR